MSSNSTGVPNVDSEGFETPKPGSGHASGTSSGGNTTVDAETGDVGGVAGSNTGTSAEGASIKHSTGGVGESSAQAVKPDLEAAQGSNIGGGSAQSIGSTTRTGPPTQQGKGGG